MSLEFYSISTIASIISCGLAIKLMDDYIDRDYELDCSRRYKNISLEGLLPYSFILITISLVLNLNVGASLFCASYIIGMFHDMNRIQGIGLRGYQESLIVLIFSAVLIGIRYISMALLAMLIIQICDDIMDRKKDKKFGQKNLANSFGIIEVSISLLIFIIIAALINFKMLITILVCYGLIMLFMEGYHNVVLDWYNCTVTSFFNRLFHRKKARN